jgi:hypothetical protein
MYRFQYSKDSERTVINAVNLAFKSLSKVPFPFCQISLSPSQLNNFKEAHSLMSLSLKLLRAPLAAQDATCLSLLLFHFSLSLSVGGSILLVLVYAAYSSIVNINN